MSCFFACLCVCLSVCHQDYLPSNEQICMKFFAEVRIETRNKQLHFVDDFVITIRIHDPEFYSDRARLRTGSCSGGLQFLTDCLVSSRRHRR